MRGRGRRPLAVFGVIVSVATAVSMGTAAALAAPGATPKAGERRLVSLAPNLTEILHAVGAGGEVVGVTDQCDFPAEAKAKAKVGSYVAPNLESLVTLRPTTVFATEGNPRELVGRIAKRGVEVVEVAPRRAAELAPAIRMVAARAGRPERGEALAKGVEAGLARLREGRPRAKRYLLVLQLDPLISVSDDTWLGDVFKEAGYENVVGASKVRYPVVSDERLVVGGPDVVFAAHEVDLARLRAKARGTPIVVLPPDVFVRPGPRIVEAFEFLAAHKASEARPGPSPGPSPGPTAKAVR